MMRRDSEQASLTELAAVKVVYVELPGWTEDISTCTAFEQLPQHAQDYVRAIEKYSGTVVSWVGVGPGREEIFVMPGI